MPGNKQLTQPDTLTFVNEAMTYEEAVNIFRVYGIIKYVNKHLNRFFIQFESPDQAKNAQYELGRIYRVAFAHAKSLPRPKKNFRVDGNVIKVFYPTLPSQNSGMSASNGLAMIEEYVNNAGRRRMTPALTQSEVARSNENPKERDRESGNQRERPKGSQNGREMARSSENRRETSKGSGNSREMAKGSGNSREMAKGSGNSRETSKGSGNSREMAKGFENRRETSKGSGNRRDMAKSSKNQSQKSGKQNHHGKPANPKSNSSQVRGREHDVSDDSDDNIEEPKAQKPKAQKRPGEAEDYVYDLEEEEEDDDDDVDENEEEDQQEEARAPGAGIQRRVRIEELDAIMRELGSDVTYSVIMCNIPEKYTLNEVYDLVEEVKPIAFSEMDYSFKMRVKFCEIFVNDQGDVNYLKQKLNDFVICGKQLTVMEPAEILDETRWNA